ncbi:MAG TPA: T9SS type A sorting domain-containing protein [Flavobacteriales bacterium]
MEQRYSKLTRFGAFGSVLAVVLVAMVGLAGRAPEAEARNYHSAAELASFRSGGGGEEDTARLPMGTNQYFMGSGRCAGCHGYDPAGYAGVTPDGVDVNVTDDWRSTMMANSARDPFWRAKVSHEGLVNPDHRAVLEDKCTSCHAPAGRHDKHMLGHGLYSIAELMDDSLGLDGVSCVPCHIQSEDSLGLHFSGKLIFDTLNRPLYGPYANEDIFGAPMSSFVGYEPQFGAHVMKAGLCAGCHTLITATSDLSGQPTGGSFVEQATYHEWLNSRYNEEAFPEIGISCQGCHMPRIFDGVVISANYLFLQPKSPFGLHHLAGGNTFMLEMLKEHKETLGVPATDVQFDSTIARTNRLLQQNSLLLDVDVVSRDADTAFIDVKLTNLTGHKFPTGYPSRRAWIELEVTNSSGTSVFRSGGWDEGYEVIGHDADWERHYDLITDAGQAQIYEMVMGDVNGDKTTVLDRAAVPLKDNRLPPLGFSTGHITYDTTLIANVPVSDTNFNHDATNVEGSGTDIVHYHIPMGGQVGDIVVRAKVWYQSSPPKWMEEMFDFNSTEIDLFRSMYEAADNTPVLVRQAETVDVSTGIDDLRELGVRIFPNPVRDGHLVITGLDGRVLEVTVHDVSGRLVARRGANIGPRWTVELPPVKGTYIVSIRTRERTFIERVVSF